MPSKNSIIDNIKSMVSTHAENETIFLDLFPVLAIGKFQFILIDRRCFIAHFDERA